MVHRNEIKNRTEANMQFVIQKVRLTILKVL